MNNPASENGKPLPERPATVPANAYFVEGRYDYAYWAMSQIAPTSDRYIGEYAEWDLQGQLLLKRIYHDNSGIPEDVFTADILPEKIFNDFYTNVPVISRSRHYSYNNHHYKEMLFDESGQLLYTLSQLYIPTRITRRYYNHVRIFEIITAQDDTSISVQYFYPDGTVMASYQSHGDDTGTWSMYNKAGQITWTMPLDKEEFVTSKQRWHYFLPDWTYKPAHPTIDSYIDAIVKKFTDEYDRYTTTMIIQSLPIPDYLQMELDKTNWHQLETAVGTGEDLPVTINGLLTGDDHIAEKCAERVWWRVGVHGCYYDAAYATATVLAHILPSATETQRLLALLYKIMSQPALRTEGYAGLVSSIVVVVPQLRQWAVAADPVTARQAQHILMHAGQGMPDTEILFQQEWQNITHPIGRRVYTLYCLGRLYEIEGTSEKMRSHFIAAYKQEPLALLQTIMAIFLVRDAEEHSEKSWINTIIHVLDGPDTVLKALDVIETFTGWEPEDFLVMVLEDAKVER